MEDCRPMDTPMVTNLKKVVTSDSELVDPRIYKKLIGSLMYLVNTMPYICFIVNALSQFMVDPRKVNWIETNHVLRYFRGTMKYELRYCWRRWSGVAGIYKLKLGRECNR